MQQDTTVFSAIYDFFDGFLPESVDWLAFALAGLVLAIVIIVVVMLATALNVWFERRALARQFEDAVEALQRAEAPQEVMAVDLQQEDEPL